MAEKDVKALIARLGFPDPAGRQAQESLYELGSAALPELAEALRSSDLGTARRAAVVLGWMNDPNARKLLLEALRQGGGRPDLRAVLLRAACEDAGPGDAAQLLEPLLKLVGDSDYFVRAAACDGLGRLGDARAEPVLRRAAADPEAFVRDAASRAFAALPPAARAAGEGGTSGGGAGGAAGSKGGAGTAVVVAGARPAPPVPVPPPDPAARLRAARTAAERDEALDGLVACGPDAVADLELLCDDVRPPTRLAAVRGLLALRDRRSLGRLVGLVESDPDADVRGLAARALTEIARPEDASTYGANFVRWTHDPDGWVRAAAAVLVGIAPPPDGRALGRLVALLSDRFDPVVEAAARACSRRAEVVGATSWPDAARAAIGRLAEESRARTGPDELVVAILELCAAVCGQGSAEAPLAAHAARLFLSGPPAVRGAAVRLLGASAQGADPELAAALVALLEDPAPETRRAALQALASAGAPPLGSTGLERVARFLHEIDPATVEPAVDLLARLGTIAAARLLCEAARAPGPAARLAAAALDAWPPDGDVAVTRDADGIRSAAPILRCGRCRRTMSWTAAEAGKEELRCAGCGTRHAVGARDRVVPVADAPLGACVCPTCARPHLLVNGPNGLSCPVSGEGYVMVSDTREVLLIRSLPYGVCACCASAQPLEREVAPSGAPRILCHRTRTEHVPDASGRYAPVAPPASLDGSAIDRALLAGSLRVGRSGVAAPVQPPGEDDL